SNGYAVYRRRDTGVTAVKSSRTLDNRCVVPYNRDLVVKYQAHINVEVCHRGQLIKYLFKYITKGPDRSSPVQSIVGRPGIENTMLTQWFSLNKQCPSARKYTYDQIPNAFVFIDNCEDWTPRKKGFVVGRIPMVPAAAGDIFYLRILLGKVYGTQSFRDLRTYNGVIYRDYQETCQAMGLLATDDEWHLVMSEVNRWWHPSQMRYVFVSLIIFCELSDPIASLGIVAALLPDGLTAHSRFKILLNVDHSPTCMVKKGMTLAELLKAATLIVWDEAPMVHRLSFEVVDRTLCDIMNIPLMGPDYQPFGGKTILLGGDFRQTLPVVPNGGCEDNINASLPRSSVWNHCTLLQLSINMRINDLPINNEPILDGLTFSQWVLSVGNGLLVTTHNGTSHADWIKIPQYFVQKSHGQQIQAIIASVYPDFTRSFSSVDYVKSCAIVTPTNAIVSEINDFMLNQIPGELQTYFSADSLTTTGSNKEALEMEYHIEFLNSLSFNGIPEHDLKLKPFSTVMLLRNLNPLVGLCNGTQILLTNLGNHLLQGLIVGGTMKDSVVAIPCIVLDVKDGQ
ncbi:hypothetical protein LINPERHAP2_LOCUS24514, partial [Linum perenne]